MIVALWLVFLADPAIKLPETIQGMPGAFIPVQAQTSGKSVKFFAIDSGLNIFPSNLLSDPKATVVTSVVPGRYRLLAYTSVGEVPSDPVVVTIVVGTPDPTPPAPPAPNDPLLAAIQGIFGGIQDSDKLAKKATLTAIYRQCATLSQQPSITTTGQLYQEMRKLSLKSLTNDDLMPIRERMAQEVSEVLPAEPDANLTEDLRKKVLNVYNRLANIMERVQ